MTSDQFDFHIIRWSGRHNQDWITQLHTHTLHNYIHFANTAQQTINVRCTANTWVIGIYTGGISYMYSSIPFERPPLWKTTPLARPICWWLVSKSPILTTHQQKPPFWWSPSLVPVFKGALLHAQTVYWVDPFPLSTYTVVKSKTYTTEYGEAQQNLSQNTAVQQLCNVRWGHETLYIACCWDLSWLCHRYSNITK
jgi:hypothetical protein